MKPAVRTIPFIKASACGNDFLLIDAGLAPADIEAFTRRICDRHDGVGADGVEWMSPHFSADAEIRLINADGSPAEISGNGTRCVAAYVCAMQGKERVSILTGAGVKVCTLTGRRDAEYEFEAEMGKAGVDPELGLSINSGEVRGIPVSMGNPHFVIFVGEFIRNWQSQAAEIQKLSQFPEGVNVEYVVVDSKFDLRARFFERGAGETRSSGTGSCASAVAAMSTGRVDSSVKVHAPGGTQTVRRVGDNIFLRGPARLVCRGEFFLG
ncbi:MAG TPA: diaminopimelate epimerase [Candidatus Dormibacteraeota bacterium]|nr:diaminopimelate epimerase [Candidatus Dormibacteraeota bacterium]